MAIQPPFFTVIPVKETLLLRVMAIAWSAWPVAGVPVVRCPSPSMVPAPAKETLVRLSPQISESWKWLCP
jgi:hypothetical protein